MSGNRTHTFVVIGTDCTGSCIFNSHTITTTTVPYSFYLGPVAKSSIYATYICKRTIQFLFIFILCRKKIILTKQLYSCRGATYVILEPAFMHQIQAWNVGEHLFVYNIHDMLNKHVYIYIFFIYNDSKSLSSVPQYICTCCSLNTLNKIVSE